MASPEAELVLTAFEKFSRASDGLQVAYYELAERFESLSKELEQTNLRLRRTVREKERIGHHLHTVLESLDHGVLVADRLGRITHWNQSVERVLFGEGNTMHKIQSLEDLVRARPELEAPLDPDGPTSYETRLELVEGGEERSLQVERHSLVDPRGDVGAVFVVRDLTSLRALEQQAQRMERLAAMGEMAMQLAHEVRNPLGSIRLHTSILSEEATLSEPARSSIEQMDVGIRSLDNVVSNMLNFGQSRSLHCAPTDVEELIEQVQSFLEPLTRERQADVRVITASANPCVHIDEDQFRQVFLNLWLNALNAMPRGGRLEITLRDVADELVVEFRDNGPGVPAEVIERVFDPYFTTDRKGSGLGLAVASLVVKQHGGTIRATSEPGRGTTFWIHMSRKTEGLCAVAS